MLPKVNPTLTSAWRKLIEHHTEIGKRPIKSFFDEDPDRASSFSLTHGDVLLDFSKHCIDRDTLEFFSGLAEECKIDEGLRAALSGERINETENRSVMHTALRDKGQEPILIDGENVRPLVETTLEKMKAFASQVISGDYKGVTGLSIQHVVNIGIGGSDLGPHMATEALTFYRNHLDVHFVSNVDASHLVETLKKVDPARTLFIVASKTFTTQETMTNAVSAKNWLIGQLDDHPEVISRHFIALSTNSEKVTAFGIDASRIFGFWDWVGGRYSLWSSIGLSLMLAIGPEHFKELLDGAYDIDGHVKERGVESIPGRMAVLSIWCGNFFNAETHAILPYDQYLNLFPSFLQQADMESNGKSIDRNGDPVDYQTGSIIWGEPGTNGQHAFYQLIHQGTKLVPCDFIAFANPLNKLDDHHEKLLANCFAQSKALMEGKSQIDARVELEHEGVAKERIEELLPFKVFPGNVPSTTLLVKKLTPFSLGQLVALYEHKILIEGLFLNIYSFDQWGVELGKQLALPILAKMQGEVQTNTFDASTDSLISAALNFRSESS